MKEIKKKDVKVKLIKSKNFYYKLGSNISQVRHSINYLEKKFGKDNELRFKLKKILNIFTYRI